MTKALVVSLILGGLLAIGIVPRYKRSAAVAESTREAAAPRRVILGEVKRVEGPTHITLPGSASPFRVTGVYAKTSGFVKKLLVDLGDRVRSGQILAELEVPENDEELRRARAQVEAAEANIGLFEANAERSDRLLKQGIVSKQQAELAREAANSAQANAKSSRADVQRLSAVQRYGQLLAPFAGVVSRRLVEPGQLVNVGAGPALLIEVSDTSKLRVFFDVPQALAGDLSIGQKASVSLPSSPQAAVEGEVVRTAGTLDPTTRTLRAEVDLRGDQGILAGAFVNVRLAVQRKEPAIVVPASALVIRKEGPRVAAVESNKVRWAPVQLGRDLGKQIEIVRGIEAGARVVLNPPDDLAEGETIRGAERSAD